MPSNPVTHEYFYKQYQPSIISNSKVYKGGQVYDDSSDSELDDIKSKKFTLSTNNKQTKDVTPSGKEYKRNRKDVNFKSLTRDESAEPSYSRGGRDSKMSRKGSSNP